MKFLAKLFGCREDEVQTELDSANAQIKQLQDTITALSSNQVKCPPELGKLTYAEANDVLRQYCNNLYLSDSWYSLTSVEQASLYTIQSKVSFDKWVAEMHDCDNFSAALWGYWSDSLKSFAIGIAWSATHAFNIFIDDKKKVYIIEPQTNAFIPIETAKDPYMPLRLVVM